MNKILVPIDTSGRSKRALATAAQLADALKAELILLTVLETEGENSDEVSTLLTDIACDLVSAFRVRVEYGLPARVILSVIDDELPDLVVMSSHGGNGPDELALGSVARDVLKGSAVPITLVGQDKAAGVG